MHWHDFRDDKDSMSNHKQIVHDNNSNFESNRKTQTQVLNENHNLANRKSSPFRVEKNKDGNIQYSNAKESNFEHDGLPKLTLTVGA